MSEESNVVYYGESLSWGETWVKALTQPSEESYHEIANDPGASSRKAYSWVFISSLIGYVLYTLISLFIGRNIIGPGEDGVLGASIAALLCGAPLGALFAVLGMMLSVGISQWIAYALDGTGTYSQLIYTVAAYVAPLSLISSLLSVIPYLNCMAIPLLFYGVFLNVTAVKAVNRFGWGKAIISSVLILFLLTAIVAVILIVVLTLLGPAIGNVFSDIISELGTPVP